MVLPVLLRPGTLAVNNCQVVKLSSDFNHTRFPFLQIPFSLTLRVWDLFILEGDRVLIAMAFTILQLHRRRLMKQSMDEAIEYLQITLPSEFGLDDDSVIEKLRENMHDLRSQRLDHPGKAPPGELPEKPFGLLNEIDMSEDIDEEKKPKEWTAAKEAGLRTGKTMIHLWSSCWFVIVDNDIFTGFTQKEREFSHHNFMRQQENNNMNDVEEEDEDLDETAGGKAKPEFILVT